MDDVYWGPGFSNNEISKMLSESQIELEKKKCNVERIDEESELCKIVANEIADGKVVGWFQGRMEWGPRALGNRSILYHAREPEVNHWLNKRLGRTEFMQMVQQADALWMAMPAP